MTSTAVDNSIVFTWSECEKRNVVVAPVHGPASEGGRPPSFSWSYFESLCGQPTQLGPTHDDEINWPFPVFILIGAHLHMEMPGALMTTNETSCCWPLFHIAPIVQHKRARGSDPFDCEIESSFDWAGAIN